MGWGQSECWQYKACPRSQTGACLDKSEATRLGRSLQRAHSIPCTGHRCAGLPCCLVEPWSLGAPPPCWRLPSSWSPELLPWGLCMRTQALLWKVRTATWCAAVEAYKMLR